MTNILKCYYIYSRSSRPFLKNNISKPHIMETRALWKVAAWSVLIFLFSIFLLFLGGLYFSLSSKKADIFSECLYAIMTISLLGDFVYLFSSSQQSLVPLFGVTAISTGLAGWLVFSQPYYLIGPVAGLMFTLISASQLANEKRNLGRVFLCLLAIFFMQTTIASFLAWKM